MLRKTVQKFELALIIFTTATICSYYAFSNFGSLMFSVEKHIEIRSTYGNWVTPIELAYVSIIPALISALLCGIFLARNTVKIATINALPLFLLSLFVATTAPKGTDWVSLFSSVIHLVVFSVIFLITGLLFNNFSSPITSQNWKKSALTYKESSPGYFIIISDIYIALYLLTLLFTFFVDNILYEGLGRTTLLASMLLSLIGITYLRREKLAGALIIITPIACVPVKMLYSMSESGELSDYLAKLNESPVIALLVFLGLFTLKVLLPMLPLIIAVSKNRKRMQFL